MTQVMARRIVICRFKPAESTPSQKSLFRLEYGNAITKVLKNHCAMQILASTVKIQ